ncbi:MAG: class I SAM-dependent methyltransferase [Actinomycetota bacterium]|nr:class I SAM-dependent methyltransferase [Actinomycetota bacterium]
MDLSERRDVDGRRHPWELARARFFRRLIDRHVDVGDISTVLDVGAGDGWFAGKLADDVSASCRITCWDVNYSDAELNVPDNRAGRVTRTTEPPDGTFDLILLLDVIEHIAKDEQFLRDEITPRMHARSRLVVSVPAYQRLSSHHDVALGHQRRYGPSQLRRLLAAHFEVDESGGLFTSLLALRAAALVLERAGRSPGKAGVGRWGRGAAVTKTLTAMLEADARSGEWLGRHHIAVPGLSTWAVSRLPGKHLQ